MNEAEYSMPILCSLRASRASLKRILLDWLSKTKSFKQNFYVPVPALMLTGVSILGSVWHICH